MAKYALKRVLLLIPTLLLVCVIVFVLLRTVPGSAVDYMIYQFQTAGVTVDQAQVEHMLGMDKPAVVQFFDWFTGIFQGDLGESLFQAEGVWDIISRQLPVTLELGILTLLFSNMISIPLGIFCAARQDSVSDYLIRIISVLLLSLPVFWIATIVLVYPAVWFGYAPPMTYVPFFTNPAENMKMFLVPALLGAFTQAGMQLRTIRTMTLETMRQDYIRTCWAKGVGETQILFIHALRNSMIPIITMIGGSVAGLVGGSVILETMFNMPGIGAQVVAALDMRDYPLVQGCVLVFSIFVMVVNLIVDLTYKWIDPRVELE
ncbi:MAG: ABC transporter permease [Oscillospiraceae bacterium]|nr:ABC transporter permease [Oscillospiraceae bacterium]